MSTDITNITTPPQTAPRASSSVANAREHEAVAFLYRKHRDGSDQPWSDGWLTAAKVINPFPVGSVWSRDDVDEVYQAAAEKIVRGHREGRLCFGITASYCKAVIHNTAVDYWREHHRNRGDETSLSAPGRPKPKQDSGGAAVTVEASAAAPPP